MFGPLITSFLILSIFHSVTISGIVSFIATCSGTPTSDKSKLGSGEITVLLEKSTLFPDSDPLNLPSFPLSLWVNVFSGRPERWWACGIPETSLSKYVVAWYCNKSTKSWTINGGVPASLLSFSLWLTLIISTILCVRSSSDLIPVSRIIDGLTVTGGTGKTCRINHSGLAVTGSYAKRLRSSSIIWENLSRIVIGSNLCSPISVFSTKIVGFVKISSYWVLPQWGHSFAFFAFSIICSGIRFSEITVYAACFSLIFLNSSRSSCGTLSLAQERQVDCKSL